MISKNPNWDYHLSWLWSCNGVPAWAEEFSVCVSFVSFVQVLEIRAAGDKSGILVKAEWKLMGWRVLRGHRGKKGVVTFNRPAPTGQGTDWEVGWEVGVGQKWTKEDMGGADTHTKALSVQWSGLSPSKPPCKHFIWINSLKCTWNMTLDHWWHHLKYNSGLRGNNPHWRMYLPQ